jgi:DNA-binding response OmpR family regulator
VSGAAARERLEATVLVVDGEVLVRLAIAAYLRDCGFRVIEASGADEARAVIGSQIAAIDVALIGLGAGAEPAEGFALARELRQARPGVEVVLAATPARAAHAAGEICEQGPMLARPYEPQLVIDRIRRLMARRRPPGGGAGDGGAEGEEPPR